MRDKTVVPNIDEEISDSVRELAAYVQDSLHADVTDVGLRFVLAEKTDRTDFKRLSDKNRLAEIIGRPIDSVELISYEKDRTQIGLIAEIKTKIGTFKVGVYNTDHTFGQSMLELLGYQDQSWLNEIHESEENNLGIFY